MLSHDLYPIAIDGGFSLHHFRFQLEPKALLHMPACLRATHRQAYNKGNVIRGGFGSTFRLSARAQAGMSADRQSGLCVMAGSVGGRLMAVRKDGKVVTSLR